jgi:putative ABC transport system permease protein
MTVSTTTIIRRELRFRWFSAFAAISIVAAAVALVLCSQLFAAANEEATRRIQRDIGLNVVILPPQTELDAWWIDRIPKGSMPESWIDRLQDQDVANRLVPMLVARVELGAGEVLLTGIAEERFKRGKGMKPVFGRSIESGGIILGASAALGAGVSEGDSVTIRERTFTVSRILEPSGSEEDVRAWVDLADAQSVLDMPGRLNEIRAIECHCSEDVEDPLGAIRAELAPIVPGARIVRMNALADARRSQRQMAERLLSRALPPGLVLAGVIIAMLAFVNVRERRGEMGILMAHGRRRSSLAVIILARSFVIGILGGALGWTFAQLIGESITRQIIGSGSMLPFDPAVLAASILFTPILCMLTALYPAMIAAMIDPARLMRTP